MSYTTTTLQSKKLVSDKFFSAASASVKSEIRESSNPPPQNQYYRSASLNILAQTGPVYVRTGDIQLSQNDFEPPLWTKAVPFFYTNGALVNQSSPALQKSVETDRN